MLVIERTLPVAVLAALLALLALAGRTEAETPAPAGQEAWRFKAEFRPYLIAAVPKILETQDPKTGRFGTGVWIVTDQNVLYPLAAAWALEGADNPHYHDPALLDAIMRGGDALIDAQDARGMWVFRKKDNSTWGDIYMPWTYSRWLRAYSLIRDAMPPERRARWEKALTLGYEGIAKRELTRPINIPAHHAMGLYLAGQVLDRPEWSRQAATFMRTVATAQHEDGYWSEHSGPVVGYNFVYADAVGTYHAMSGDPAVLPALERLARFHAHLTYPDGTSVETVDERQTYKRSVTMPNVGFTFSDLGRGYLRDQWERIRAKGSPLGADLAASFILYGEEGPAVPAPARVKDRRFVLGKDKAALRREGPWFVALSAYTAPVSNSRWIQDRQNFVSLFHERAGLILGGGNTKLQPLWSTFTVGDAGLLSHRPGDEDPDFTPRWGLIHVPERADLDPERDALSLRYGAVSCAVHADLSDPDRARLVFSVARPDGAGPVAAHVPLLPRMGESWETASGRSGTLGAEPVRLDSGEAGAWLRLGPLEIGLPPDAALVWPALPHDPYVKDGRAGPASGRFVVTLPFPGDTRDQAITVRVVATD